MCVCAVSFPCRVSKPRTAGGTAAAANPSVVSRPRSPSNHPSFPSSSNSPSCSRFPAAAITQFPGKYARPWSCFRSSADNALDLTSIQIVAGPANGSVVVNGDGTVSYTHNGSETTSDSFTYAIRDAAGAVSNVATVSLTVTPVNDAPLAVADAATLAEGASTTINLAANDTDPDNALDLASIQIVSGPANGSVVVNGDGTVSYTHNGSETTSDSFTYTIRDA